MSHSKQEQGAYSKAQSIVFIVIAYSLCIGAAACYLMLDTFAPLRSGQLLLDTFIADLVATVVIFIFSRVFKNSSFYDAYWSVIPPLVFHYWLAMSEHSYDPVAMCLMGAVIWYWAIRLTWNWAKHWPGLHHEDWRYALLKEGAPKFEIFTDFFGIHFFPTVQVFLGMLPIYALLFLSESSITALVYLAFIAGMAAATIQLISDRQLHTFLATRKDGEIIHHGLWKYSRHPNYFGELLFWVSLSLFGLASYPEGWWWQLIGSAAMLAMFLGASIPLMEKRSLERRPQYQSIIDSTSMLIPFVAKRQQK